MKCTQIEEMLPLYAGEDLSQPEMQSVRTHLAGCEQCSGLAADLGESVSWFRETPIAIFEDAELAQMRAAVNRTIEEQEGSPGLLNQILASINWKPVFAAAAAIILLAGAFYSLRSRDEAPKPEKPDIVREAGAIEAVDPGLDRPPIKVIPIHKSKKSNRRISRHDKLVAQTFPTANENKPDSTEPLRIEMQTADPNIRIIWMAHAAPER